MEAWKSRSPSPGLVYHSDRGPNFRSFGLGKLLLELGVLESFSRPHTPYDNSVNEAFFKSLKTEELYRRRYSSAKDFKDAVSRYVKFYNEERPHQAIRQRTPGLLYTALFESHGNFDNNAMKFHRLKLGQGIRAPPKPLKTLDETARVKYGVSESDTPIQAGGR